MFIDCEFDCPECERVHEDGLAEPLDAKGDPEYSAFPQGTLKFEVQVTVWVEKPIWYDSNMTGSPGCHEEEIVLVNRDKLICPVCGHEVDLEDLREAIVDMATAPDY